MASPLSLCFHSTSSLWCSSASSSSSLASSWHIPTRSDSSLSRPPTRDRQTKSQTTKHPTSQPTLFLIHDLLLYKRGCYYCEKRTNLPNYISTWNQYNSSCGKIHPSHLFTEPGRSEDNYITTSSKPRSVLGESGMGSSSATRTKRWCLKGTHILIIIRSNIPTNISGALRSLDSDLPSQYRQDMSYPYACMYESRPHHWWITPSVNIASAAGRGW